MPRLVALVLAVCLITLAGVGVAAPPRRDHDIVPADYFSLAWVADVATSPDGSHAAWVELRWQRDDDRRNLDLWLVETKTGAIRRLTFDDAADQAPAWSGDGKWLYFLSGRKQAGAKRPPFDGKTQVWRIAADGSGLMPVTRVDGGVDAFELGEDGRTLWYTTSAEHIDEGAFSEQRRQFKTLRYGHGVRQASTLWRLDLNAWRSRKVLEDKRTIREFSVAPDGLHVALLTTPDDKLISNEGWSRVEILDVATGKTQVPDDAGWRGAAPSPYGWLEAPRWASDSRKLAFRISFDGYPGEAFVLELNKIGKVSRTTKIRRRDELTLVGTSQWQPLTDRLCFVGQRNAGQQVYCTEVRAGRQGPTEAFSAGDGVVEAFDFAGNGKDLAAIVSTRQRPGEVFWLAARANQSKRRRLSDVNPAVDTWKLPSIQAVRWRSLDGAQVEGILELPPGYKMGDAKAEKLPLVVEIHGGPTSATLQRMRFWIYGRTLFAARGWALLSVNYRGSTGYGDAFMTGLIGHENDIDVKDILSGVDHLVKQGVADPERMAVMGWSNGGYLTNCIITRTTRFKAASSGAGVFDMAMQWMTEDTPGHVINYMQGQPWRQSEAMKLASPLYAVDRVKTPTIIHVGERDARVPPQHSTGLYRALKRYLDVPTELLVYPGEPHGLGIRKHRDAKMRWDLAWFDHWVLGRGDGKPAGAAAEPVGTATPPKGAGVEPAASAKSP